MIESKIASLQAEITEIFHIIDRIPAENVIDHTSMVSRLEEVREELHKEEFRLSELIQSGYIPSAIVEVVAYKCVHCKKLFEDGAKAIEHSKICPKSWQSHICKNCKYGESDGCGNKNVRVCSLEKDSGRWHSAFYGKHCKSFVKS